MAQLPLALAVVAVIVALLLRHTRWGRPSLWASRLAYAALVLQAPLYFLVKGGFRLSAPDCQWTFGLALARHSLTNYPHIVLFAFFFLLTFAQLRGVRKRMLWTAGATMAMGLLVELAQGVTGEGHCRMRDLVPDATGALLGFIIMSTVTKLSRSGRRRQA